MSLKAMLPWWAKIGAKLVLSRLPVGYGFWQRLDLFKHGSMEQPDYVYEVFKRHLDRYREVVGGSPGVALEMGPGDSLATAVLAPAFGISKLHLMDAGPFARDDMEPYLAMAEFMRQQGLAAPDLKGVDSLAMLLQRCNAHYGCEGLRSFKQIPDASVDFIFSQAVLEHVRRREFAATVGEMRRVIKPSGMCSHSIDLKDHLGGALNNLRFSEAIWESEFMAKSGFYTNRIHYQDMLKIFSDEGFAVEVVSAERWEALPTPRRNLAPAFRALPDDALLVSGFVAVLRPVS